VFSLLPPGAPASAGGRKVAEAAAAVQQTFEDLQTAAMTITDSGDATTHVAEVAEGGDDG
jgi:hypothetical protein